VASRGGARRRIETKGSKAVNQRTKRAALAASLWLAGATLPRVAAADAFRYTDRTGKAHVVSVGPARSLGLAPAPPLWLAAPGVFEARPPPAPTLAAGPTLARVGPSAAALYPLIREAAAANALPAELVLAVVEVESGFDPRAVSSKGALGLMQLMPATASLLGVGDVFDPRQNVFGGSKFLRSLLDEFDGQLPLALAAYNAGAGAVRRHGAIPPIAETQGYVASVLAIYQRYLGGVGRRAPGARPPRPEPVVNAEASLDLAVEASPAGRLATEVSSAPAARLAAEASSAPAARLAAEASPTPAARLAAEASPTPAARPAARVARPAVRSSAVRATSRRPQASALASRTR
jgi:soluble lytic murein transglycosylase-like protein